MSQSSADLEWLSIVMVRASWALPILSTQDVTDPPKHAASFTECPNVWSHLRKQTQTPFSVLLFELVHLWGASLGFVHVLTLQLLTVPHTKAGESLWLTSSGKALNGNTESLAYYMRSITSAGRKAATN